MRLYFLVALPCVALADEKSCLSSERLSAKLHPEFAALGESVKAAEYDVELAGEAFMPTLEAAVGPGFPKRSGDTALEWAATLELPISPYMRKAARFDDAKARLAAAKAQATLEGWRQELALQEAFFELARAQVEAESITAQLRVIDQLKAVVGRRVALGESRPIEVAQVELAAGRMKAQQRLAGGRLRAAKSALRPWVGELADLPACVEMPVMEQRGVGESPATLRAREEHRAALAAVALAHAEAGPELGLSSTVESDDEKLSLGVGVSVSFPLGGELKTKRAEAEASAAARRAEARALSERAELEALKETCQAAVEAEMSARDALARGETASLSVEAALAAGDVSLVELLQAGLALEEVRSERQRALVEAQAACTKLQRWGATR